ncbi:MAG: hypothetical protein AB1724_03900 [Thermodesulfobacteriota bacterium]
MSRSELIKSAVVALLFVLAPFTVTWAYVGPGVGITMLGAFWTVLGVILAAVGGLLVWPIRSFWRWKQGRSSRPADRGTEQE